MKMKTMAGPARAIMKPVPDVIATVTVPPTEIAAWIGQKLG